MKTRSAKDKGRKLQKHVAEELSEVFELEDGDVESRPMGSGGVDIMMSPLAKSKIPVSIECKHTKKAATLAELKQARNNCKEGTTACVVWQPHGARQTETMITFNLREFLEMWKETNGKEDF